MKYCFRHLLEQNTTRQEHGSQRMLMLSPGYNEPDRRFWLYLGPDVRQQATAVKIFHNATLEHDESYCERWWKLLHQSQGGKTV